VREKILELLRQAGGSYLSGEEIAKTLGVSRTAVWKHIRDLKKQGYGIISQSRSGYALREVPDHMIREEIMHGLGTQCIGRDIRCFEQVGSTNTVAKELAETGAPEGTVVVAEQQGAGRGRLERHFFSPYGRGIWFSFILRPEFLPQEAPKCTLMAAVAVAMAMEEFDMKPGIKWPNDILYEGRKIVGILTEMSAEMEQIRHIIIGIGINVNIREDEFPEDIRDRAASLLMVKGAPVPRIAFFQAVLRALDRLYGEVCQSGFAPVMDAWRAYNITLGHDVHVIGVRGGETFDGKAVDIDAEGALLVDTPQGRKRVLAGDVSVRTPEQKQ